MTPGIYQKKIDSLVDYFKSGESTDYKLGLEIEHFILNSNFEAVPYRGINGIEGILKSLEKKGWEGIYENENILGLKGKNADISLEPGGQFELSLYPLKSIKEINEVYNDFLYQITPIIETGEKILLAAGYQPVTKIKDIELLPKKRYHYMYNYFKDKGKYAHNMMKGTASIQLNLDYNSEEDFIKKMRVSYFLSPLIYFFFDNGPFFEGDIISHHNIRSVIWDNCDSDRCGLFESVFNEDFSYEDYAEYVLNLPAIITMKSGNLIYTGKQLIKDIYDPLNFTDKETEHLLTMAFPDVRLKKYIEIRMGDSLPYPYPISYVAFWQGLLYNPQVLAKLNKKAVKYTGEDINRIKNNIRENGLKSRDYGKPLLDFMIELLDMASISLNEEESIYLDFLREMVINNVLPKNKTLNQYNKSRNKISSLQWCKVQKGGYRCPKKCTINSTNL